MSDEMKPSDDRLDTISYVMSEHPQPCFTADDIAEVVRYALIPGPEGYADEELTAVVRLKDGRFVAIEGACDTTGWDCQAHLDATLHDTEEDAWLNGITQDGRAAIEREERGS